MAWADQFDAHYNNDNPGQSGFDSPNAARQFDQEGLRLWERLRQELGAEYKIVYQSVQREQLLETPSQLGTAGLPGADAL